MKHFFPRVIAGILLGLSFALLQCGVFWAADSAFHDHTNQPMRCILSVFNSVNAPALGASHVWTNALRMPPRGEVAWVLVPAITVALQWSLIGAVVGLLLALRFGPSSAPAAHRALSALWWTAGIMIASSILFCIVAIALSHHLGAAREHKESDRLGDRRVDDAERRYRTAVDLLKGGRPQNAIDHLRAAIAIRPNFPEAHYQMGLALTAEGKHADAIIFLRKAIELQPDFPEARQRLEELSAERTKKDSTGP